MQKRIAFVGCSAAKSAGESRSADERYCSQLFNARKNYCDSLGIEWYVLSAKFGLLKQNEMVREYDTALTSQGKIDLLAWHVGVAKQFLDFLDDDAKPHKTIVEIHAGEMYCQPLDAILRALGFTVVRPVQSLGIGMQLAAYKKINQSVSIGG
jgi:hypothetical protein